jgi:hypothetical protein
MTGNFKNEKFTGPNKVLLVLGWRNSALIVIATLTADLVTRKIAC